METNNQITSLIQASGLEQDTALALQKSFEPFYEQASQWKQKAFALVITSADQKKEIKEAKQARKAMRDIRIAVENERKRLKENSLRTGKAIDGVANVLKALIEPIESHLEEQEKFVELQDLKRREERKIRRAEQLFPYVADVSFFDLLNMEDAAFEQLLAQQKAGKEAIEAANKKAEEDRIAKEKSDAEAREAQRLENERLKAEAAEKEKALELERAKVEAERKTAQAKADADRKAIEKKAAEEKAIADAKIKAAQEAQAKVEAELKAKADAEVKAKKEADDKATAELKAQQLAEKKAAKAPDKQKLLSFSKALQNIIDDDYASALKSSEAKKVLSDAKILLTKVVTYITEKSETL